LPQAIKHYQSLRLEEQTLTPQSKNLAGATKLATLVQGYAMKEAAQPEPSVPKQATLAQLYAPYLSPLIQPSTSHYFPLSRSAPTTRAFFPSHASIASNRTHNPPPSSHAAA
jgi:hypothetical protein